MAITADPYGSWSERNIANIADCMDSAFANVLEAEFTRLTAGMTANQIGARLYRSERSIGRLRNNRDMPDYSDPMVVLRYVILYQLGHVNLAYTLIKNGQRGPRLTDTGALQVVDFGAGTLAMSFGAAMAVADALADGENVSEVRVDAIDTGHPMMELGLKLWSEFGNETSQRHEMEPLTKATELIQHFLHDNYFSVQKFGNSDCWLSSLHTLYDDNEATVRSALATLCGTLGPDLVALTCFAGKSDMANRVVPTGRNWQREREPRLLFVGSINNSHAASVAFDRGFQPTTWYNRRLYADVHDAATFISKEQVSRPAPASRRPSAEAERWHKVQEEARQRLEQERQQRRQEEARRQSEHERLQDVLSELLRQKQGAAERLRRQQEEARHHSDRAEHQRQQWETQHHSGRGISSKIRSGLSRLFRRRRR